MMVTNAKMLSLTDPVDQVHSTIQQKMTAYEAHFVQNAVPSTLQAGERELVWVIHDECTFYLNDGANIAWLEDNETILRKKSQSAVIMLSEFLCLCHGNLKLDPTYAKYVDLEHKGAQIIIYRVLSSRSPLSHFAMKYRSRCRTLGEDNVFATVSKIRWTISTVIIATC